MRRLLHIVYVFILSFGFSAIWELSQLGFYEVGEDYRAHISACLIAAVWDSLIVTTLYLFLGLINSNLYWERWWTITNSLIILLATIGISTFIELRALNAGSWAYSSYMPLIPGLGTGLLPTIQLAFTAFVVFYIAKNRFTS